MTVYCIHRGREYECEGCYQDRSPESFFHISSQKCVDEINAAEARLND